MIPKAKRVRVKEPRKTSPAELKRIREYLDRSVPPKHQMATERALLGQMGKAMALKQKCLQCCNYEVATVKLCTVFTCALFPVRPYQTDTEDDEEEGEE
jgi:hypothetical protein